MRLLFVGLLDEGPASVRAGGAVPWSRVVANPAALRGGRSRRAETYPGETRLEPPRRPWTRQSDIWNRFQRSGRRSSTRVPNHPDRPRVHATRGAPPRGGPRTHHIRSVRQPFPPEVLPCASCSSPYSSPDRSSPPPPPRRRRRP